MIVGIIQVIIRMIQSIKYINLINVSVAVRESCLHSKTALSGPWTRKVRYKYVVVVVFAFIVASKPYNTNNKKRKIGLAGTTLWLNFMLKIVKLKILGLDNETKTGSSLNTRNLQIQIYNMLHQ